MSLDVLTHGVIISANVNGAAVISSPTIQIKPVVMRTAISLITANP